MRIGILYKLAFPNGKVYIGITRETLDQRVRRHIAYARAGKHFALSCAIRKYGETSFAKEVLASGTWDDLKELEIAEIARHDSLGSGGYNMTGGGDGSLGVALCIETKLKISGALTGRALSNQHRARLSEAQIGKVIPEETRRRMSAAATGREISAEQREKISQTMKGRKRPDDVKAKIAAGRKAAHERRKKAMSQS